MESEHVVYPSPPAAPTPKGGETDESDDSNDKPADDDKKGEQCGGSGEDPTPNKKEDQKSEGESDDQSKAPKDPMAVSGDSGLGTSSPGDGVGTGTTVGAVASNPSVNPSTGLPLPTQLPTMDHLEKLADDLCTYSGELFQGLEETSMAMLDRVLSGFKRLGGRAREYIYETAAIAINFFSRAGDMEVELESSEALKFQEAINGMKESIRDLIRQTALAEESYKDAAAHFNNILSSVSNEQGVRRFTRQGAMSGIRRQVHGMD